MPPRDRRGLAGGPVHADRMLGTLPEQPAALCFEMADGLGSLHAVMWRGSRMTWRLPSRSSANTRWASRTSSTASCRLARASSRVSRLRVGAGQLLDVADVALGHLLEHGGELELHESDLLRSNVARSTAARHGDDVVRRFTFVLL